MNDRMVSVNRNITSTMIDGRMFVSLDDVVAAMKESNSKISPILYGGILDKFANSLVKMKEANVE